MNDHTSITLRRSLDVPPERIWELWTTPEGIGAWWAPDGFQTTVDGSSSAPAACSTTR